MTTTPQSQGVSGDDQTTNPTPQDKGGEGDHDWQEVKRAADAILGPVTMELGRFLYDAPSVNLVPLLKDAGVKITAKQFMDLYKATDDIPSRSTLTSENALLKERVKVLEGALEPFAMLLRGNYQHQADEATIIAGLNEYDLRWSFKLKHFRRARSLTTQEAGE